MNYLIISGNPKGDGLCASVTDEAIQGAKDGGASVGTLFVEKLERCHVCGEGWGPCREQHRCAFGKDGFDTAQDTVKKADQLCFITPVYWGEMAESLKSFFDRLRRCEFGQTGSLAGKQILLVASPGGTGNGLLSCLEQMDRFCHHTGAVIFDYIGINRWNNDYKKKTVYAAAKAMTENRKAGETLAR
ncbi:flavodoxin family protein [Treponema primitia]|uniref:flavodoxin family protein n=1 Tax=Treponema primitia TaxID=88058 RepID=UPI0039816FB9